MTHHFRFIVPLLGKDEDGLTPLHYYDSAIQLARHASREPTEQEYMVGMRAAKEIQDTYVGSTVGCFRYSLLIRWDSLNECLAEMREGSSADLSLCEFSTQRDALERSVETVRYLDAADKDSAYE